MIKHKAPFTFYEPAPPRDVVHVMTGTIDLGLWHLKGSKLSLISYLNADFANC
jgi:hypothetical protein